MAVTYPYMCDELYLCYLLQKTLNNKADAVRAAPSHARNLTAVKKHSHFRPVRRPSNYVTGDAS
jgi:hypothetical protein